MPSLLWIAQIIFLLQHGHTQTDTKSQMSLITVPTHWLPLASVIMWHMSRSLCYYSVAARLLERKSVVFKDQTLLISEPCDATPRVVSGEPRHCTNTIKVTNVAPALSKEVLKLYFESAKRSGGGEIKDLHLITEKKKAFVTFKDPDGMFCLVYCNVLDLCLHSMYTCI